LSLVGRLGIGELKWL